MSPAANINTRHQTRKCRHLRRACSDTFDDAISQDEPVCDQIYMSERSATYLKVRRISLVVVADSSRSDEAS